MPTIIFSFGPTLLADRNVSGKFKPFELLPVELQFIPEEGSFIQVKSLRKFDADMTNYISEEQFAFFETLDLLEVQSVIHEYRDMSADQYLVKHSQTPFAKANKAPTWCHVIVLM